MQELKKIVIGNTEYPYKIDLNVLEKIQNEYGSIHEFEKDILGVSFLKDEDEKPVTVLKEPSIRAIKMVLPAMVNEGLEIEAEMKRTEFVPVSDSKIIRECSIPYKTLGRIIHEEFKRCFSTKKI